MLASSLTRRITIDVEVFGVSFFKEIKFNCSRLNGVFGFQYSSITQTMESNLSNGGGQIGSLRSRSDMNGWGPKFALEGFRPIGNTRLELFATVGGAVQFGHRDQFVANSTTGDFDRVGADEFVTTVDFPDWHSVPENDCRKIVPITLSPGD